MKYKMTVLYYSKAGNAETLARAIAREQQTKGDQSQYQHDQQGLGHEQSLGLNKILPLGRFFPGHRHRRHRLWHQADRLAGQAGDPADTGPKPHHLPGKEGPEGTEHQSA